VCDCDCCGEITVARRSLASGQVKRCLCLATAVAAMPREGLKGLGGGSIWKMQPERVSWSAMIRRCTDENCKNWKDYGGRGIQVCDKWRYDFTAFLQDVGPKPGEKYTLERIDVDGDYEPGNVRWATKKEQTRNKRRTIWVRVTAGELADEVLPLVVAAERLGLTRYKAEVQMHREDGLVQIERPRQAA
jgi:hypothetical protein